ncbi:MAG: sterol desaturase family protein [Myxococcota bacterium]
MMIALAVAAGVLTWSFLEYCIHRWLGHDKRTRPNFFSVEHVRHHSEGNYFAPAWKKAAAAGLVFVLVGVPSVWAFGPGIGLGYVGGLTGFYLFYEVLHRREHTHEGIGPYGRWARRHHFTHHFRDPKSNHGVTSPLFDLMFGTYRAPEKIRVPRRLQMRWLADPDSGRVHAHLQGMYELR